MRLQDFAEQALKFHNPTTKQNETRTRSGQSEQRVSSRLGITTKGRFTEVEITKIHELVKELGQRSRLVGRRIWTEEEERKIEKVALEINRFSIPTKMFCFCGIVQVNQLIEAEDQPA